MLDRVMHDKEVSTIFKKALLNEEFVVYYQPKVDLNNNQLCGCEALVRWVKDGKVMPPMEFIPVLEREGSVCKLDFYVFEKVCRDINQWLRQGIEPVRISTNFSKAHLHNRSFADDIVSIMRKYEVDSRYLEVELTEMSGYEDYDALSVFVDEMKDYGVKTSIDDFGTGYSSLNLLKDLNVDVIKLDKSFLNNIEKKGESDEIVIKSIIKMVTDLNMKVIAEGVETVEQAEFLKDAECCMAQGFLFDKPLPRDEFEKRLKDRQYTVNEM
jgi:EAL domain-containing protein (putative c-di-GMP-specific phosphodiesterase class I)